MLIDVERNDAWCDARIFDRSRIESDMKRLGLLNGPAIGTFNATLRDLNALTFDVA